MHGTICRVKGRCASPHRSEMGTENKANQRSQHPRHAMPSAPPADAVISEPERLEAAWLAARQLSQPSRQDLYARLAGTLPDTTPVLVAAQAVDSDNPTSTNPGPAHSLASAPPPLPVLRRAVAGSWIRRAMAQVLDQRIMPRLILPRVFSRHRVFVFLTSIVFETLGYYMWPGQSLGKRLCQIKIVNATDTSDAPPSDIRRNFLRSVLINLVNVGLESTWSQRLFWLSVMFGMLGLGRRLSPAAADHPRSSLKSKPERRCLHDMLLGTRVVTTR